MTGIRAVAVGVGHYLPQRVVPNEEFTDWLDTSDEWIRARSGIERRHFAAEGELTSDLAAKAAVGSEMNLNVAFSSVAGVPQ